MANGAGKEATLHQKILGDIEGHIVSGEWPPGFRLPFEVNLAEQYGCSRMTVNKVMTQLAKDQPSRVVFVVLRDNRVTYRYAEPEWKAKTKEEAKAEEAKGDAKK